MRAGKKRIEPFEDTARWAPRLLSARACTSSMITVSMSLGASRALDVSSRNNDSGVVIHTSGGFFACRVRSD